MPNLNNGSLFTYFRNRFSVLFCHMFNPPNKYHMTHHKICFFFYVDIKMNSNDTPIRYVRKKSRNKRRTCSVEGQSEAEIYRPVNTIFLLLPFCCQWKRTLSCSLTRKLSPTVRSKFLDGTEHIVKQYNPTRSRQ